jgi:murein DD-endopeptidase MepM/ murein hydrolase activator NlpD
MARDDRFYAFFVARTSRSRSRIRKFSLPKSFLRLTIVASLLVTGMTLYGFYGLTQEAIHLRVEHENARLRAENSRQRQQLHDLNQRVEAVEDTSRRLAEMSGVNISDDARPKGSGGPAIPVQDSASIMSKAETLQRSLQAVESVMQARMVTPSIWPVLGNLTDSFGGRRNPFGGSGSEFHAGQDIATAWGTAVDATAAGTVIFAGWQNGYGQVVIIDHGGGLTTRYGHLSEIDVSEGQQIAKAEPIGKVGSSGRSTGPHLHYEVRLNDEPVDPRNYLPPSE